MRIKLLRRGRRARPMSQGCDLSRGAQRVAQLGQSLSLLGAGVAVLLIGIGIMFACLINEPIYHRVGSAMILGVLPGLVAYAVGRLLRRCLMALSLMYDPFRRTCSRAGRRAASTVMGAVRRIGQSGLNTAGAADRRVRQAWNGCKRMAFVRRDATGTWEGAPARRRLAADGRSFLSWSAGQLRTIAPISRRQRLPARV